MSILGCGPLQPSAGRDHLWPQSPCPRWSSLLAASRVLSTATLWTASTSVPERWTTATLTIARKGLAATAVGGKALFAGGISGNGHCTRVDLFHLSTGEWSTAELSEARSDLGAATLEQKAIFAGGQGAALSDRIDIYDSITGTWSPRH